MKASCLAITVAAMAIGLSAPAREVSQDKIPELQKPRPEVSNTTTVSGCIAHGTSSDTYVLTHVMRDVEGTAKEATEPLTLMLSGSDVDVGKHVGHKVSVTGWDVTADRAMGTTRATETSKPATEAMAKKPGTTVPGVFTVKSLKMMSASCSEPGD
jgi:hypothetical protein